MVQATDYMRLVKKEASKLHAGPGGWTEWDDLVSEGNLILCQCIERFKPELGVHFSVYLRSCLEKGLREYRNKGFRRWVREDTFTDEVDAPFTYDLSYWSVVLDEAIDSMSEPAQQCIKLVVDPPEELLNYRTRACDSRWGRKITRHTIRKYLLAKGWYGCQITSAFKEIQTTLHQLQ